MATEQMSESAEKEIQQYRDFLVAILRTAIEDLGALWLYRVDGVIETKQNLLGFFFSQDCEELCDDIGVSYNAVLERVEEMDIPDIGPGPVTVNGSGRIFGARKS